MNIIIAILILGILIVVHELGHFIVAKLTGVYVEKFSIGMGPRLFGIKYGETDYCVSAFPLGGYVKMYGEQPDSEIDPNMKGRAFLDKNKLQKAAIIVAGPVANLLLAVVIFWGIFMTGYPSYSSIIGEVEKESVADIAGLVANDKIVAVNNKKITSWDELLGVVTESVGVAVNLKLADDRVISVTPVAKSVKDIFGDDTIIGDIGVSLYVPSVIGSVKDGYPAKEAGLEANDKFLKVNGADVSTWTDVAKLIRSNPEVPLDFVIAKNSDINNLIEITITPKADTVDNKLGLLGITAIEGDVMVRHGVFESLKLGFKQSYDFTKVVLIGFAKLVQRAVPADSVGGPIMIVQMAADSANSGLIALLSFMAVISVNLAVLNLLPIPVLDGGHLLIIAIEAVTRRKLSERILQSFQTAGFMLLMALMVFAFYNDIARIL